jgi:diguanylate cyclase (GGDEF)-like protein
LLPNDHGAVGLTSAWTAVFALETMLYVVGTAFIVLALAKDRVVRAQKNAAATDELTGLLNRRGFLEAARELMRTQAKKREPVSVLIFDLDFFKSVNDRFGHAMGDEVLRMFGHTVTTTTRETDLAGRFGGEEFVTLVPGSLADAMVVGERVRAAFEEAGRVVAERELGATVSVGAACGRASDDLAALLVRADAALYRAKDNGRNRVESSEEELPTLISIGPTSSANRLLDAGHQAERSAGRGVLMAAPASGA